MRTAIQQGAGQRTSNLVLIMPVKRQSKADPTDLAQAEDFNRDRPMLRKVVPLDTALAMLRRTVEDGAGISQSCMAFSVRGRLVHVMVRLERGPSGYWVHWTKYGDMNLDTKPYLDIRRRFASLDRAIEWMEGKTRIPFADFHR